MNVNVTVIHMQGEHEQHRLKHAHFYTCYNNCKSFLMIN